MRLLRSSHAYYCGKEPPTSCTWKWRARALLRVPNVAMLFSSSPVLSVVITSIRPCGVPALERFSKLLVSLIIHMTTTPCVYGTWNGSDRWPRTSTLRSSILFFLSHGGRITCERVTWTRVRVRARHAQCVVKRRAHAVPYTVYYIRYALNKQ